MVLLIRVIPRAAKNAVTGRRGEAIVIRLAAPPVEGAANEELTVFLAELFDRPRRDITILSGHKARDKRVQIDGISDAAGAARVSAMLNVTPDDSR
jgi:uncharacterized protein (TIGR00251 family)